MLVPPPIQNFWPQESLTEEKGIPCFITGEKSPASVLVMTAKVWDPNVGRQVVAMFGGLARMECLDVDKPSVHIKIGVTKGYEDALFYLGLAANLHQEKISPDIIAAARMRYIASRGGRCIIALNPSPRRGIFSALTGDLARVELRGNHEELRTLAQRKDAVFNIAPNLTVQMNRGNRPMRFRVSSPLRAYGR